MKKVIPLIFICLTFFWASKIYSINQHKPEAIVFDIGETVDCGDLELHFDESHLDDLDEFNNRFGVEYNNNSGECKLLSVCIDVKSKSDADIEWDDVFRFLECGFESPVWGSVMNPEIDSAINTFHSDCLAPGESQKIWFVSPVNKVCFKEKSWERIDENQYYYVLSLSPKKIAVRLKV